MWSNETETANNNMTSLKSKITHRKRKNSKSKSSNAAQSIDTAATNGPKKTPNKQTTNRNNLKKNNGVTKKGPDLIENLNSGKRENETHNKADVTQLTTNATDSKQQLVTDAKPDDIIAELNSNFKRYSDSFVINGCDSRSNLTNRTYSELSVNELDSNSDNKLDKIERRSRRFSDIFRYGALKPSTSCENIKSNVKMMHKCDETDDFSGVELRRKSEHRQSDGSKREAVLSNDKKSKVKRNDSQNLKNQNRNTAPNLKSDHTNDSYLKRVKSKIYKTKNGESTMSNGQPTMPKIVEKSDKKSKKKKAEPEPKKIEDFTSIPEIRKSTSHFDFRLIRQTSNLERIRPKTTFGLRTASSNLAIPELVNNNNIINAEKPVLAKAKSSSAINLNLLRTRRNKLLEQAKRNCKIVQNEFDFFAFNNNSKNVGVQISRKFGSDSVSNSISCDLDVQSTNCAGETKPGHPVSRTGSDRRPDAVREESSRTQQESSEHIDHEADVTNQDSTVSLPAYTGNKKRVSTNINRSESVKEQSEKRKQRRNISDPLHNTTHETVDLDQHGLTYQTNSGSSSNSSLSSRSSESPSASLDAVSGFPPAHPAGSGLDSDMEVEADPPDWQSSVPQEELANLPPHDKKRQDVINELFHTERSHVRNLRVLDYVFKKPLQASKLLKPEDINLIFPNLSELLEIHSHLNSAMKSKRKESPVVGDIGDMLLNMFDGTMGENFQSLSAAFCERQQLALAFIKEKRKKDSRFDGFLIECEKNYLCRRLGLQGILPTEMQRLSKYPLLLERLIDSEVKNKQREPELTQAELSKLKQAHDRSKEILNHVNEAAKIACNRARLKEIQKHLDTSLFEKFDHSIVNEYKNLDFTRFNLIHEGAMHLRRPDKLVALHVVLLEEAVILLQKDAERFVLKFFQSGISTQQPIAPVIKISTLLVRENAASKSSFFLVNTSTQNSQLVDLLARDKSERDIWLKHISDVVEAYNSREGKSKRSNPTPDVDEIETLQDLPIVLDASERAEHVGGDANSGSETESGGPSGESSNRNSDIMEAEKRLSQSDGEPAVANEVSGGGVTMRLTPDDWPLVQPTEVHVAVPPVHTAEPVLTPLEQIKRKDEEVRRALADKEDLVADLLSIPREEYKLIADMASEVTNNKSYCDKEPSELVLAAVFQTDQLLAVVNESLNISEADAILATGGRHSSCASNENAVSQQSNHLPSVPCHKLQDIATTLSTQLTTLLSLVKQRDEERDRLRRELQRTRELHDKLVAERSQNVDVDYSTVDQTQSSDLESIQESLTENDNN